MSNDSAHPLGSMLQQRREELGASLEQVQAETRIRVRYLKALEAEEFEALPDPIVGRGFLRNYAAYLGIDPEEALRQYGGRVTPPTPVVLPVEGVGPFAGGPFQPVPLHKMPGFRRRRALLGVAVLLAVAALAALGWWAYPRIGAWVAWIWPERPAGTATEQADLIEPTATRGLTPTASATRSPTLAPETPTSLPTRRPTFTPRPSLTPSPPVYTGIFLELVFTDTSWIQVTVDGVRQEQGSLPTGTYRTYYGEQRIELRIGNAGAVVVTLNGQKLGPLGASGEVVDRVFELAGGQVSEATLTPEGASSGTPEATAGTPRATTSVTPSATAAPPTGTATPTATP